MTIGITDNRVAQKRYSKKDNHVKVMETDSTGSPLTTGDGTQWNTIGYLKDTDLQEIIDEYKDKGSAGKVSQHEVEIEQMELGVTLMQRDEKSRLLTRNAKDKFYQVAIEGQTLGTVTEYHAMWGKIMPGFTYPLGGEAKLSGIKIVTINNSAAVTVTLPTDWTTGTITIAAGEGWNTKDI